MNLRAHIWVLCVCVFAPSLRAQTASQGGIQDTIRGRLINAATGEPMPGIYVAAQTMEYVTDAETVSGLDGRFVLTGLPDKAHFLSAFVGGENITYNFRDAFALLGETWTVGDTQGKEILFKVARNPIIAGTVRDEFGDPVEGAAVQLLRMTWQDGHVTYSANGPVQTDDRGRFRISTGAGSYVLCAKRDKDPISRIAPQTGPVDVLAPPGIRYYQRTCTSDAPTKGFQIAPGKVREVDLTLASGPGVSVQGQISGGFAGNAGNLASVQLTRDDSIQNDPWFSSGTPTFRFDGVPPGVYRLRADMTDGNSSRHVMGNTTIEVGSEDLTGLSLNLQAAPRIDVSIHAPANYTVGPNAVFIDLRPVNPALFHFFPDRQPDGSIRFQNVEPGTYWLVDRISDDHLCVESAKFQGQEVLRSPMKVTAGLAANLDVTLTTTCSTIQGAVFANNQPLPFATVTLLVSGSPGAPGDVFTENADKDGKFGIVGLPPGRYLLWAWGRDDPSYLGPMNLASVEAQAAAVVVGLGQTANTAVVAVAPPGAPK